MCGRRTRSFGLHSRPRIWVSGRATELGARALASRGPHLCVQSWYAAVWVNPAAMEAGVALRSNAEGTE